VVGDDRICWQFKERQEMAPLLQLSSLEEEGMELASAEQPLDAQLAMAQMKALIEAAVESLPAQDREIYELRDLRELSGEEVAKRLNISLAAMKSRLHRARKSLREKIDASLAGNRTQEELWKSP
jgi:RNA polymerase sigma-70 factor (ECF subfamily)